MTDRAAALRESHAARAMGLLESTAALGWDPVWKLADSVYDSLRAMPAFAALQQRVTFGAK